LVSSFILLFVYSSLLSGFLLTAVLLVAPPATLDLEAGVSLQSVFSLFAHSLAAGLTTVGVHEVPTPKLPVD